MKTYFVHLDTTAITTNTDGEIEVLSFRNKRAADKKILELIGAGYKFDRFGWQASRDAFSTSNPDYAPTPDAEF